MLQVLIVDPNSGYRAKLRSALNKAGYDASEASEAPGAFAVLDAERVVLVIADSVELLGEIRSHETHRLTPVIIVGDRQDRDTVIQAAQLSVSGYLLKPVDLSGLMIRIRAIIGAATQTAGDMRSAMQRLQMGPKDYEHVVADFRADLKGSSDAMRALLDDESYDAVVEIAASLSESASRVGAVRVIAGVAELMAACRHQDQAGCNELVAKLVTEGSLLGMAFAGLRESQV